MTIHFLAIIGLLASIAAFLVVLDEWADAARKEREA